MPASGANVPATSRGGVHREAASQLTIQDDGLLEGRLGQCRFTGLVGCISDSI